MTAYSEVTEESRAGSSIPHGSEPGREKPARQGSCYPTLTTKTKTSLGWAPSPGGEFASQKRRKNKPACLRQTAQPLRHVQRVLPRGIRDTTLGRAASAGARRGVISRVIRPYHRALLNLCA